MPKKIKVLVLEDDLGIQETLSEVFGALTPYECKMTTCEDALAYIQNHSEFKYLLFVDLAMPGMGGWEFLKRVKPLREKCKLRLIVITGLDSSRWGNAVTDSDRILTKPFSIDEVIKEVEGVSLS